MELLELKLENKTVHAGLLPRAYARIIDGLALGMFSGACYYFGTLNIVSFVLSLISYAFIIYVYMVYAHYKYGATFGKYVASIRVTRYDGSPISMKQSFWRSSVDLLFIVASWCVFLYSLFRIGLSKYYASEVSERLALESENTSQWYDSFVQYFPVAWLWASLIVLLLNKRKRSLHDYLGKTVVVFEEFSEIGKRQDPMIQIGQTGFFINLKTIFVQLVLVGTIGSMLFWIFF